MLDQFDHYRQRVDRHLDANLNLTDTPPRLIAAMRYGVFNGGKRIRPILTYLAAEVLGITLEKIDQTATAIELIHAYSLIHDDLPAMDDDDLRRGKPTCHIEYGEATAILAGDALQTLAFEVIAKDETLTFEVRTRLIAALAKASGAQGMIAGQVIDLESERQAIDQPLLEQMHHRKTGELISLSVSAPAIIASDSPEVVAALRKFGFLLGLAFQVRDDILDVTGTEAEIGKPIGSDSARDKSTFVSIHGAVQAQAKLDELAAEAEGALLPFANNADKLVEMTRFIVSRRF